MIELSAEASTPGRRRKRRDPNPRFLPDRTAQLDCVLGCAQVIVPKDHLAWRVRKLVAKHFDTSLIEAGYSSLGRHGHAPKHVLAVWIYASIIGVHYASEVERLCKTDAAFRLLSGGHAISASTLKRFRSRNAELFAAALQQTVAIAHKLGLLLPDELATDSMRLRAHASLAATHTRSHSAKRLRQLAKTDEHSLDEQGKEAHRAAIARHQSIVDACDARGRSSVVTTNESAGMMKFPHGAAHPGHRLTVTSGGASERIVVGILIDSDGNDSGKLPGAAEQTLDVLARAGVQPEARRLLVADAGYCDALSLRFAEQNRDRIEVLIADALTKPQRHREQFFGRDRFTMSDDQTVVCPVGRPMDGAYSAGRGKRRWFGVGCDECPLRSQCTSNSRRTFTIRIGYERDRQQMRTRLADEDSKTALRRRSAIIEPVFSSLESVMKYRRASSRFTRTIVAEVLLKLLAHNVRRLFSSSRLAVIWLQVNDEGAWSYAPAPETGF